ncbi:MAG: helix-turn-helix domain-containing protein [Ruminococcus sp.]|nr:helix-turn-helix domain-containing protein [Ruminococcus sp.]
MYEVVDVVQRIKDLARQKGIKTSEMLIACELSKNALSSMGNRGSWIQANSLAKIADYLNVSVDYLLGRSETPRIVISGSNINQQNIGGNASANITPDTKKSLDSISEKFMEIFNNLPFEEQLAVMNIAVEKSKKYKEN